MALRQEKIICPEIKTKSYNWRNGDNPIKEKKAFDKMNRLLCPLVEEVVNR